jgi:sugar transferase (PEP-CTERM/EpsH1 system associated)
MNGLPLDPGAAPDLLFLAPCLPCASDGGDALRWYQMLRFLGQRCRVHLGCFVDPRRDRAHLGRIKALCYETCFVEARARAPRLGALAGRTQAPLPARAGATLAAWTARLRRRHPIEAALACSARMVPYLARNDDITRVVDLVDVESERLQHSAAALRWPAAALRRREERAVREHERDAARDFDHLVFASGAAAALFRQLTPEAAHKVATIGNGVDADWFSPHIVQRNPFAADARPLLLAGPMDDRDNAEAACWFAREVFAALRAADPALQLHIVGARPTAQVRALARIDGVSIAGAVPDLRPWLAHAALVVAPLQSAHGRNDTPLAAMAMRKQVVASPHALASLDLRPGAEVLVAADAAGFQRQVRLALAAGDGGGNAARERMLREHGWPAMLAPLDALLGLDAFSSCGADRARAN